MEDTIDDQQKAVTFSRQIFIALASFGPMMAVQGLVSRVPWAERSKVLIWIPATNAQMVMVAVCCITPFLIVVTKLLKVSGYRSNPFAILEIAISSFALGWGVMLYSSFYWESLAKSAGLR